MHPEYLDECGANTGRHGVGVATDIDIGALVCDQVPDLVGPLDDRILNVASLWIPLAREHGIHLDHTVGLIAPQLIFVEVVVLGGPAAKEQQGRGYGGPVDSLRGPLLQEAAEGRQPGTGPDHDHGQLWIIRRPEGDRRLAYESENRTVRRIRFQVAGAHPIELADPRASRAA